MLQDGVYSVQFTGPLGTDYGTVIIEGSRIHGGDTSYFYIGSLKAEGRSITARIRVAQHQSGKRVSSVFGSINEALLELEGNGDNGRFTLSGRLAGASNASMTIAGTKSSPLDQMDA